LPSPRRPPTNALYITAVGITSPAASISSNTLTASSILPLLHHQRSPWRSQGRRHRVPASHAEALLRAAGPCVGARRRLLRPCRIAPAHARTACASAPRLPRHHALAPLTPAPAARAKLARPRFDSGRLAPAAASARARACSLRALLLAPPGAALPSASAPTPARAAHFHTPVPPPVHSACAPPVPPPEPLHCAARLAASPPAVRARPCRAALFLFRLGRSSPALAAAAAPLGPALRASHAGPPPCAPLEPRPCAWTRPPEPSLAAPVRARPVLAPLAQPPPAHAPASRSAFRVSPARATPGAAHPSGPAWAAPPSACRVRSPAPRARPCLRLPRRAPLGPSRPAPAAAVSCYCLCWGEKGEK
jgi:hypothetical protein